MKGLIAIRTMTLPQRRPEDALLSQDISSFFKPKPKPGRKKKRPRGPAPAPRAPQYTGPAPAATQKQKVKATVKKSKVKVRRTNWTLQGNKEILQQAVEDWLNKTGDCEGHHTMREFAATCGMPFGTLASYVTSNTEQRSYKPSAS